MTCLSILQKYPLFRNVFSHFPPSAPSKKPLFLNRDFIRFSQIILPFSFPFPPALYRIFTNFPLHPTGFDL